MTNLGDPKRFDWYTDHPVREQMKEWGFTDSIRVHAAFTVYLDLCEAKTWWNVNVHPCQELEMVYITGKPDKKADIATVLPIRAHEEISMKMMDDFLQCIPPPPRKEKPEGDVSDSLEEKGHVITLAVVEADSTIVYYNISNDLQQPKNLIEKEEEETTVQRKRKKRKPRWNTKRKDTF